MARGNGPGCHVGVQGHASWERASEMACTQMSLTCKQALAVFTEYHAQLGVVALRAERDALKRELALFGTAVGCVQQGAVCSNCHKVSEDCQCRAWTCRCYSCWVMRRTYSKAHKQGRMLDAASAESTLFFRMVDDSSDDALYKARMRAQVAVYDSPDKHMLEELLRD